MIRLVVTYYCKENQRDSFLEAINENQIGLLSRQDHGNIQYDYFKDIDHSHILLLLEKWENQESLDEHFKTEHLKKAQELGKIYCDNIELEKYFL